MSGRNISIEKRLNLFFLITLLIIFFTGSLAIQNKNEFIEITGLFIQSFYAEKQLDEIHDLIQRLELEERDFMLDFSNNTRKTIDSLSQILSSNIESLKPFIDRDGINIKNIDTLQHYIQAKIYLNKEQISQESNQINHELKNKSATKAGIVLSNKIKNLIQIMSDDEERVFYERSKELESLKNKSYFIIIILIVLILLFMIILMIRIKNELKIRHRAENELLIKSEELIQLNKSRNMLYSIIAHDLRSPFQPILTLAEILNTDYETLTPKQIKDYAGKLNRVGRDVLALLDNLLEWTKVQTGKMHFYPESIILKERVEWAFNNLRLIAETKNILLVNEIDKNLLVTADMNMILSIIQNLISNAIKFTANEGMIKVSCEREENYVLISVSDNGVGMTDEQLKTIFKIGSNHSTPGTNRESGSGLGLLLCKELVDFHGGQIWVESEKGKGSTFYFTIPDSVGSK